MCPLTYHCFTELLTPYNSNKYLLRGRKEGEKSRREGRRKEVGREGESGTLDSNLSPSTH